jgi:hypothetical protein
MPAYPQPQQIKRPKGHAEIVRNSTDLSFFLVHLTKADPETVRGRRLSPGLILRMHCCLSERQSRPLELPFWRGKPRRGAGHSRARVRCGHFRAPRRRLDRGRSA